jgi:hypothetical protein
MNTWGVPTECPSSLVTWKVPIERQGDDCIPQYDRAGWYNPAGIEVVKHTPRPRVVLRLDDLGKRVAARRVALGLLGHWDLTM